ncbi:MAG: ABC transporter substrate-binding protein [Patulibacter minatonensis]
MRGRPRPTAAAAALLLLAGGLVACGGDGDRPTSQPSAGPRGATVAVSRLPTELDPALATTPAQRAIAVATQTPLLTYRRTVADDAAELQPALAGDLPELSEDDTEYRFQLRRGLVYADGRLLKASDVERGIAHASVAAADPELRAVLRLITGTPSRDGESLSGVRSDDRTGVIVVQLRRPDGRLPYALADPATAPMPELPRRGQAPASTGPLRIASRSARSIELAANPLRPTISTVPSAKLAQVSIVRRPSGADAQLASGAIDLDLTTPVAGAPVKGVTRVTGPTTLVVAAYVSPTGALASRSARAALADAIDTREIARRSPPFTATCGILPPYAVGATDREPCPAAPADDPAGQLTGRTVRIDGGEQGLGTTFADTVVAPAVAALGGTPQVGAGGDERALRRLADGDLDVAVVAERPTLPHPALWLAGAESVDALVAREVPKLLRGPLTGTGGRWAELERRIVDRGVAIPLATYSRTVSVGPQVDRRTIVIHPILGLDLGALDLA